MEGTKADPERIELEIDAGSYEGTGAWPMGVGVPLPRGQVSSVDGIRIRGEAQGILPTQVKARTAWPDGSLQWIWADFQGDPHDRYFLEMDPGSPPMPTPEDPVRVVQEGRSATVDTGPIRMVWDPQFATPIEVGRQNLDSIRGDGQGITVVDNRGRKGILGGGQADLSWQVEEAGPMWPAFLADVGGPTCT